MPATIFAAPPEIPVPQLDFRAKEGVDAYHKECDEYVQKVQEWARANTRSKNDLVGLVFRYGVADGYAQYVVLDTKPLRLVHLPIGDAWHIPDIVRRGLCLKDIQQQKERSEAWAKLTAKKAEV